MNKCKLALTSVVASALVGCGQKLPECGDQEAIKLVQEIITKNVEERVKGLKLDPAQVIVSNVETVAKNKELKKNICRAEVKWKVSEKSVNVASNLMGANLFNVQPEKIVKLDKLFAGLVLANQQLIDSLKPTPEKFKQIFDQQNESELKNAFGMILMGASANFAKIQQDYPYKIGNDTIDFSEGRTTYYVRMSEDKSTKDHFLIEVEMSEIAINMVSEAESLGHYEAMGEKYINRK